MKKDKRKSGIGIIIFIVGMAVPAFLFLMGRSIRDRDSADIVLWINERAVSREEYQFYEQKNRARSSSYFYSKYQADISGNESDWDQIYGGETPREILRQNTEEELLYDYALQRLSQKNGCPMPNSYAELQMAFQQFNQERKRQVRLRQPIYGPEQYSFQEYYTYFYSEQKNKIIEAMGNRFLEQEKDKVKEYYLSLKPEEVVPDFQAELEYYHMLDELPKEEAQRVFEDAINLLREGKKPEEQLEMGKRTIPFYTAKISLDDSDSMELAELINTKKEGEMWINEQPGKLNGVLVLKKLSRERLPEFKENQQWAAGQYASQVFEEEVRKLIADAKIRYVKET